MPVRDHFMSESRCIQVSSDNDASGNRKFSDGDLNVKNYGIVVNALWVNAGRTLDKEPALVSYTEIGGLARP